MMDARSSSTRTYTIGQPLTATNAEGSSIFYPISTIAADTTLAASALPTTLPSATQAVFGNPPQFGGVGVDPFSAQTYAYMQVCCNGADIVIYNSGFQAYCLPEGQTISQLENCYHLNGMDGEPLLPGLQGTITSGEDGDDLPALHTVSLGSASASTSTPTQSGTPSGTTGTPSSTATPDAAARLIGSQDSRGVTLTGVLLVVCLAFGALL